MVVGVLSMVGGLVLLVVAADRFVVGAEAMALHLRWSPAVIGAVVVGFGTSLPELVTSAIAAAAGEPDLAIGNAAGSNVANLLLILGIAAVVAPLRGPGPGPWRDVTIAGGAGGLLVVVAASGGIGAADGTLLLAVLGATVWWQVRSARGARLETSAPGAWWPLVARVVVGLVGVVVGAQLLVSGATTVAAAMGVPSIVVGSVLVAVGTSLPELATAVASARRGQLELLLGNLLGSNAFNALGVVGVSALVGVARGDLLRVDLPAFVVVVAAAAVTVGVGGWVGWRPRLGRRAGAMLVVLYAASVPALLRIS